MTLGDSLTSVFGGVVIFSFIGSMANTLNVPVADVATKGSSAVVTLADTVCNLEIQWSAFRIMFASVSTTCLYTICFGCRTIDPNLLTV